MAMRFGAVKRPFDGDEEGGSKRKAVDPVREAARKEARANLVHQRKTNLDEEYNRICGEIAPLIASVIDSFGGVSSVGIVSNDPEVKKLIEKIPTGFSTKVKKIVEMYPDYIVQLEGVAGDLATAAGYENGIVSTDGTIDKEKRKQFLNQKRAEDRKNGILPQQPIPKGSSPQLVNLQKALVRFQACANNPSDVEFQAALAEVKNCRAAAFSPSQQAGGGFMAGGERADPAKLQKSIDTFVNYIRGFMTKKNYIANQNMKMSEIASDTEAKRLHAACVLHGGKKYKMSKILTDDAEGMFIMETDPTGMVELALTDIGADPTTITPHYSTGFTGKGYYGKGKGGRW